MRTVTPSARDHAEIVNELRIACDGVYSAWYTAPVLTRVVAPAAPEEITIAFAPGARAAADGGSDATLASTESGKDTVAPWAEKAS